MGKKWEQWQSLFSWAPKSLQMGTAPMKLKDSCALEEKLWPTRRQHIKKQRHYFPTKVCLVKAMVYPVVMYGCESWSIKKADHRRIDAFKLWCWRTLESLLDSKEIKAVHPKGNQSWIFIGRIDAEAETPILWSPDVKNWLIGKDPDAGKDGRWEEKGTTEDEMVGWHHRLNGHELEQTLGVGDGQGSLACSSPWGCEKLDTTSWEELTHWNRLWCWEGLGAGGEGGVRG